jgi:hypothetical protein
MLFGWELVVSFILVSVVYAVAIGEPSFGNIAPFAVGLSLVVDLFAGEYSADEGDFVLLYLSLNPSLGNMDHVSNWAQPLAVQPLRSLAVASALPACWAQPSCSTGAPLPDLCHGAGMRLAPVLRPFDCSVHGSKAVPAGADR